MILTWDIIRRTIEVLWIINIAFAVWTVLEVVAVLLQLGHGCWY